MTEREIPKRGILKFPGILNEFKLRNSKILKNSRIPKCLYIFYLDSVTIYDAYTTI